MSAANFATAIRFTMDHEGGARVTKNPDDPGGLTKYGISQRAYPNLEIAALTESDALRIYRSDYWDRIQGDALPSPLDLALFDYAFNSGATQAICDLQHVLRVKMDGIIGPTTLGAIGNADPLKIANSLLVRRLYFLGNSHNWKQFGLGWAQRVLDLRKLF